MLQMTLMRLVLLVAVLLDTVNAQWGMGGPGMMMGGPMMGGYGMGGPMMGGYGMMPPPPMGGMGLGMGLLGLLGKFKRVKVIGER